MKKELFDTSKSSIPPWLMRLVKQTGKGINRFNMIQEGDKVLLAVSGGKDSLVMALCLSIRLKWLPVKYELEALNVNWREYPMPLPLLEEIKEFFDILKIPFHSVEADMKPASFRGDFNCYLCARNRKRILFEYAEKNGIKKIAAGHHLDDIAETTMINMCLRGNFSTMMPVQNFFNGKLQIIRPLCLVRENTIQLAVNRLEIPVYHTECPYKDSNLRGKIKPILKSLSQLDKNVYEHIFEAPWKINKEYLPTDL